MSSWAAEIEHALRTRRIMLQDVTSRGYLGVDGSWVNTCLEARVFADTPAALHEGLNHPEKCSQVVWCFKDASTHLFTSIRPEYDNCVSICERCAFFEAAPNEEKSLLGKGAQTEIPHD